MYVYTSIKYYTVSCALQSGSKATVQLWVFSIPQDHWQYLYCQVPIVVTAYAY